MEVQLVDLGLQVATLILGGGLGAAVLTYARNRRKDAMDAYSDLYDKLSARCIDLEAQLAAEIERRRELEHEMANLRAELAAIRARTGEARNEAQKELSTKAIINRKFGQ